jgi:uncharacterized protein (DUF2141 family)
MPAIAADLTVEIAGIRSNDGVIVLGLYDTSDGFDLALKVFDYPDGFVRDAGRFLGASIRADTGIRRAVFSSLPPGRYAVIVFQDANGDGRIDKNIVGVPTEAYGFSRNASGFLGPPGFDDAAVEMSDGSLSIQIDMQ